MNESTHEERRADPGAVERFSVAQVAELMSTPRMPVREFTSEEREDDDMVSALGTVVGLVIIDESLPAGTNVETEYAGKLDDMLFMVGEHASQMGAASLALYGPVCSFKLGRSAEDYRKNRTRYSMFMDVAFFDADGNSLPPPAPGS